MKYIIANWKANKNLTETQEWLEIFLHKFKPVNELKVIICPPFPSLYFIKNILKNNEHISLCAQDLSMFEKGSYTGETTATNLQGLVEYVLIGHSERRKYFKETDEILNQKLSLAKKYGFKSIYCIENAQNTVPEADFIAYEPTFAIGTGKNESVEEVLKVKKNLKLKENTKFIYGGSVNAENAQSYLKMNEINGLLVGTMSLNPLQFLKILSPNFI